MKRALSLLMLLVTLFQLAPLSVLAEGAWEETSLRAELEAYGSVDMAMNVYANEKLRAYRNDFDSMKDTELMAFRNVVDKVYGTDNYDRTPSTAQGVITALGFTYAENDGDWSMIANQVALYLKYLLLMVDLDAMTFDEAIGHVQQYMPKRSKAMDKLSFCIDALSIGYTLLGDKWVELGKDILNGADAITEGKTFYKVLKKIDLSSKLVDSAGTLASLMEENPALTGVLDSYQRLETGVRLLEDMPSSIIKDEELRTARNTLYDAYGEFREKLQELAGQANVREKLEDPEYLNNLFNEILASHTKTYLLDETMEVINVAATIGDTLLSGGLGSAIVSGNMYLGEFLLGTKSTYTHFHAMGAIDAIYETILFNMPEGDKWQSRYAYAEAVQQLCNLGLLGETHIYNMVVTDAGALQKLWNLLEYKLTGTDAATENKLWYDMRTAYLKDVHAKAQEYMDGLMAHYAKLCQVAEDIAPLLGHENESTGMVTGEIIEDECFALTDGSGLPDKNNPNPHAGKPIADTKILLLAGDEVIAQTVTDGSGRYQMSYPRYLAEGKTLTIQVGEEGNGKYVVKEIDGPRSVTMPYRQSYRASGGTVHLPYADDFFLAGSQYNYELALCSLGIAAASMSAPSANGSWTVSGGVGREANISAALGAIGFSTVVSGNYDKNMNEVHAAAPYTIATKVINDPDARGEEPKTYRVILVAVGGDVDTPAAGHAFNYSYEAAKEIGDKLEAHILQVYDEEVPLRLWLTGFSWGGTVADAVSGGLLLRPSLQGKNMTKYLYTFAAPEPASTVGTNLVYTQDALAAGLVENGMDSLTFGPVSEGANQARVASIFHKLTGETSYNPATFTAMTEEVEVILQELPEADGQRDALLAAVAQWQLMRDGTGTDFRSVDLDARHQAVQQVLGRGTVMGPVEFNGSLPAAFVVEQTADQALNAAALPILQTLPEEISQAMHEILCDVVNLTALQSGEGAAFSLDEELTAQLVPVLFGLGDALAQPTSVESFAYAHHPEMYMAWMLGMNGQELIGNTDPDVFNTRVLPLPINLKGRVYDEETIKPLAGVSVTVPGKEKPQVLITDEEGYWETYVDPASITVGFNLSGYEEKEKSVSAAELRQGVVELETYMALLPVEAIVITIDGTYESTEDYGVDVFRINVYSARNPNLNASVQQVLEPFYQEADDDARMVRNMRSHNHYYRDRAFHNLQMAYSNGRFLSLCLRGGTDLCEIGHVTAESYTYTFDVATGRVLQLPDLLHVENPDAKQQLIDLLDELIDATGLEMASGSTVYKHLCMETSPSYMDGKYASWYLEPAGLSLTFDPLELGMVYSLLVPYERLEGILSPEFFPPEGIGVADCQFVQTTEASSTADGTFVYDCSPASGAAVQVNGLLTSLWVQPNLGRAYDELPYQCRYLYAFGVNDATLLLPENGDTDYCIRWQDSNGYHYLAEH